MYSQVLHRIQRNQNHIFSNTFRAGNRSNPFTNTLTVLEDPQHHRKLYLIGSTHSSTLLAQRTRDLIQNVKPEGLFVQTNEKWFDLAKNITNVQSQAELNDYNPLFKKAYDFQIENGVRNVRNVIFWAKFYTWLLQINWIKEFNNDFHPFIPGLEVKYAIEEAQKLNSKIVYGGLAITNSDLLALKTETRMDPLYVAWKFFKLINQLKWKREKNDMAAALNVLGGEAFAESVDKYRAAWFIKMFEKVSPHQKKILLDKKDEDLFYDIYRNTPGKNIVAVVNQWHTEGIEYHWRHHTKTQLPQEPINPIGDMDLEELKEDELVNDYLRKFTSRLTKSEPASSRSYITQYYKDCQEYERFRHVEFSSHDDPHMYHGSPYEGGYQHHHPQLPKEVREKIEADWQKKFGHHGEHH